MEDDPTDHSNDMAPPTQVIEEAGTCPQCGSPLRKQTEGLAEESSATQRRPTEAECWKEFWTRMAYIWVTMPPALQQECLAEVALLDPLTRRLREGRRLGGPRS